VDLLEGDEEAAVRQLLQRLGIAGALDREGAAVAVQDRMDRGLGNAPDAAGLIAGQAGDQPLAEIGDGDQASSALVDDQAGIATEAGVSAGELEAGDEVELADPGDLGVARVKVDGAGGEAKRFGCRWERQEQREDENAPEAQDETSASCRLTLPASRRIARSWMPSWSR
jgi:hypothetical protein